MVVVEAPAFTRHLHEYLADDEYRLLQLALCRDPMRGDVIPDSGGFRKIRWPDPRRGKGKRGGLRIIYYYLADDQQLLLFTIYDKNEKDDMSPEQRRALKLMIEGELQERARARPREKRK